MILRLDLLQGGGGGDPKHRGHTDELVGEEVLVVGRVTHEHSHEEVGPPENPMAFDDLLHLAHPVLEGEHCLPIARVEVHPDEHLQGMTECRRVDDGTIPPNHPGVLEMLDPSQARRCAQADVPGEVGIRHSAILA